VLESQTLTRQGSAEVGQVTPMQGSRQQVFPTLQQTVPASLVQIFSGRQQTFAPLSWVEHTLPVPQHSELRPWASAPHGSCPAGQHSSLPGALTQLSPALQQIICPVTSVQGFGHVQVHVVGSRTWGAGQLATQALVAEQTSCPAGHAQAQVSWLRTLPPPQAGSHPWLPTQNSVPGGQPSQAQAPALNTMGSGQSNAV